MVTLDDIKDYETSTGSAYQVFQKLRNDNYFTWSASMKAVLESLNQWEVVTGEFAVPTRAEPKVPTKEELDIEKAWELRKKRAYTEIMLRVEDEPRVSIMVNNNPVDAWNTLKMTYGTRLANSRATLLSELVRMRYDGTGIIQYKAKMDSIRLKLLEAGHVISNTDYLSLFMSTLPEDFDIMSTTINFDVDTVEEVVNKLRQVEIRKEIRPGYTENSAFSIQRGMSRFRRGLPRGRAGMMRGAVRI